MPRKKKETIPNIDEVDFSSPNNNIDKVFLTEEQMSEYHQMYAMGLSKAMSNIYGQLDNNYNPLLSQDYLNNISSQPLKPTKEQLDNAIIYPNNNKKVLRDIGQYLSNSIMQYNRSVKHFQSILTYKYELLPRQNVANYVSEKGLDQFLKNREKAFGLLKKLNIRYQFEKVAWQVVEDGVGFFVIKETKDFTTLVKLPSEYCYVTGTFDLAYTFCVDLTFFERMNGMEKQLPEMYEMYSMFLKMKEAGASENQLKKLQYYPITPYEGWCFVYNSFRIDLTPVLKGSFRDALEVSTYKNLLYAKTALEVCTILSLQIPYDKDSKKFIMDYTQAQQVATSVQGRLPKGVNAIATPFEPELHNLTQSQSQNNLVGLGEDNYWASVGVSGSIYGGEAKSALILDYSVKGDSGFIDHIYRQFDNFVNVQLSKACPTFKWGVRFFGNRYTDDKDKEAYKGLVQNVNYPMSKLASYDYEPFEFENIVEYEKLMKTKSELQPIISGNQVSGSEDKNGRPEGVNSDGGEKSNNYDSNANAMKSGG